MALEHCFELASHRKGRGRVDNDVDIGVPIRLGEVRREPGGDLTLDIMIEQIEGGMARNIGRGQGMAPTLERRYGLNPAAGSLR